MFDDSFAPSWTPKDLFSSERGAALIAPYRSGYMIEVEIKRLRVLTSAVENSERITDQVDISRVQSIRYFEPTDVLGLLDHDSAWEAAPAVPGGRAFHAWFMPLNNQGASEDLLECIADLRGRTFIPLPPMLADLDVDLAAAPVALRRAIRQVTDVDRLSSAMRTYRQTRRANTILAVPTRQALANLVASGAVVRLDPVRAISTTTSGQGREPDRPFPKGLAAMPVVGVVDGGLSASSYRHAEAWRAPAFVSDAVADVKHGNQVTSLVVQGHDWNNKLQLPELYCRVGTVQAVPKRGSEVHLDPEAFVAYLDAVIGTYSDTKVWNFSFNEAGACDPEMVSYLGHQIALLARKHNVLPIISIGNRPGSLLQPPADCEAAITVGGRMHSPEGMPGEACPVSLAGPGPSSMLKPELSHFSHVRVLGGLMTRGSSFSTALTSPLAAHTNMRLRDPSPDLVKALLLHGADGDNYDPSTGFGSPSSILPWECQEGYVTLQWTASLRPGAAYYWELPVPPGLTRNGKLRGAGKLTAVLNPHPLLTDYAGPNYFSARIETALSCERSGKNHNLLGSIETGRLTEEQARAVDHKWSPVRHHAKSFRSVSFDGNNLKIYARTFVRDLYLYPYTSLSEVPPMQAVFVLTLGTGDAADEVYNDLRTSLGAFVETSVVDLDLDLDNDI
ncbi:S8 family serine peptidase [Pararoseomonas indoligenes]|uniref:S8 family serine peptidase n=1 Tax=Roseomonas indoligenes TaxID=2820811 RepID=A0A940S8V9_9PROT|nr:S8 family serine peptidase [Pararoseomonas indoligenes]MBP0496499.1 S8 family serine peptidase [Pararoseomonas indoligenes]